MGARNGVAAVRMVQAGFTGVTDALEGEHNAIDALSEQPQPEEMVADLGSRYFVTETAIKPYSVGYPIQSPVDAFLRLRREHELTICRHFEIGERVGRAAAVAARPEGEITATPPGA